MPNWCEGSLKLKGKYDDILRFWEEGVNAYSYSVDRNNERGTDLVPKKEWYEIEEYEESTTIVNHISPSCWIYIEDTKRTFVDDSFYSYTIFKDPSGKAIMAIPFRQAWTIRQQDWVNIAKKYNLEIKICAVESGVGFYCSLHILPDEIIIENNFHQSDKYEDFVWNCPFPWMGG